jgi:hypothetical protein
MIRVGYAQLRVTHHLTAFPVMPAKAGIHDFFQHFGLRS